jgi:hypothetical protein
VSVRSPDLAALLHLLDARTKRDSELRARALTVTRPAFSELVVRATEFGFAHRLEHHDHVPETRRAKIATFWDDIKDPERLRKAVGNLDSLFEERKYVVVHLLERIDVSAAGEFHVFYFSQKDLMPDGNHWREGEHIHYTSHLYVPNVGCGRVLQALKERQRASIPGEHLKAADLLAQRQPTSG